MKRIIFILIGLFLIGSDIWLYFKAENENGIYLLLFGIGSAIAIPIGVGLIAHAFGEKQREAFRKLAKVPEIEELVEHAETQEQKIKILKEEYIKLESTIQSESERLALTTRKEELEKNAIKNLDELDLIEFELTKFSNDVEGIKSEEVHKLRERVQAKRKGDVVIRIGADQFVIGREQIMHTPVFGFWLYTILKFWETIDIKRRRIR